VYRVGVFATSLILLLVTLTPAGDGKKKPDDKDKPPPPRPIVATVEFRDGTTLQYEFQPTHSITIRSASLGPVALKLDTIRFLDVEAERPKDLKVELLTMPDRIATHNLETIYGLVLTESLQARQVTTQQKTPTPLDLARLKRISFPDPPRPLTPY
jgi:hypothetical protein